MRGGRRTSSLPRIASQSTVPIHDRAGQHAPIVTDSGMPSESVHPPLTARENRRRHGALPEGPPSLTVPQKRDLPAGTRRYATAATRPVATRPSPRDTSPCDSAPCDTSPCGSLCLCCLARVILGRSMRGTTHHDPPGLPPRRPSRRRPWWEAHESTALHVGRPFRTSGM